jgi:hypothetical protein
MYQSVREGDTALLAPKGADSSVGKLYASVQDTFSVYTHVRTRPVIRWEYALKNRVLALTKQFSTLFHIQHGKMSQDSADFRSFQVRMHEFLCTFDGLKVHKERIFTCL